MVKKEILIVDDQFGIRLLLTDILEGEGYSVATAVSGKEAFDKLKKYTYSLVLLDYNLPIMHGGEVLRQMDLEHIEVPVIVMSGLSDQVKGEITDYTNVKHVLAKPFNILDVQELIRITLDS
ncbi:response regulator [Oceanobacillus picturae]|uniref:response regulator n=1 Tax=Oceanobacillus picturae TaxID=171693 RepID=UPI000E691615|nr:response regulator [Oceanobacillus picturae]RIU95011.1 response regulator [Oceanobacillus picturae]